MAARGRERRSVSSLILSSKEYYTTKQPLSLSLFLFLFLLFFFSLWLFLLFLLFPSPSPPPSCDPDIAPFYIYDLPDRFNDHLLRHCHSLSIYTDMCPHVAHHGLGQGQPPNSTTPQPLLHATHQFLAELIFHARAERHPCRVAHPGAARLFYVPFYAGLYASASFAQPNLTLRDAPAADLLRHVSAHPAFRRHHGRDHFLAIGRTAWDFMRKGGAAAKDFGANRLLVLPEVANVTVLTVERHPWQGRNQYGIPYPSYFHPRTGAEMYTWQEAIRTSERTHLFAFVGGPRVGLEKAAVREEILRQCGSSSRCLRVECDPGSSSCHDPDRVLEVMRRAEFCMQPPGDSFTRRSVFDAVLGGCVPVFFSEHTAYTQYSWYTPPVRPEEWSVFIPPDRWGGIEEELDRIPRAEVDRMRARVVEMIPRVTYAHPSATSRDLGFRDAVDVALAEVTKLVGAALQDGSGTDGVDV